MLLVTHSTSSLKHMQAQSLSAGLQRSAHRALLSSVSKQQYCCRANARLVARAVDTQQPTPAELKPLPWTGNEQEQQALQQLQTRLSKGGQVPAEETLQWFLRDRYFDVDEAEQKLKSMMTWRKRFRADEVTLDMVRAEYDTGKSFVSESQDIFGRPVLIITAAKHNIGEFPIEDSKRLCTCMLDTALRQLPPGGEQILGVIDLKGMSISNVDLEFVAFMVEAFFIYYPRRFGQVLLVDAPWFFKGPWEVIKPLLRKYAALVRFVSRKELSEGFFTTDTLPAQFK